MTACDAVDGSHRRHLGAKLRCRLMDRLCPVLATTRRTGHVHLTSGLPPKDDIAEPMSGFTPSMSGLSPEADVGDTPG